MHEPSSMEDEIDIEEHDVLDNPRIKSIFPDLARVKVEPEELHHEIQDEVMPDDPNENPEMSYQYDYSFEEQYEPEPPVIYDNAIILGSKPSIDYEVLYQEAVDSKPIVFLEDWHQELVSSPCFCHDCEILFPTVNALDAHKMISHSFLIALDTRPNTARKSTVTSKYCNHCDKTFPNDTALIKHLYELLPLNNYEKPPVKEKDIKKEIDLPEDTKPLYNCVKCFKVFYNHRDAKAHRMREHLQNNGSKRRYIIQKIGHRTGRSKLIKNLVVPSTSKAPHVQKLQLKPNSEGEKPKFSNNRKFFSGKIVSKVMFRCDTCQTNFLSCFAALQHWMRCTNDESASRKCSKCRRKIRKKDTKIHQLQHKYVDKFKIYKVHKSLYENVLCRCPNCNICFDEICFWTHLDKCGNIKSKKCEECNVHIYINKYQSHMQGHELKKYTKKSLIFIDFYSNKQEIKSQKIGKLGKMLFYCQHCGCCQHRSIQRSHLDKSCKTKSRKYCDTCGLYFTAKSYTTHIKFHELNKLSLKDYRFKNLFTYSYIDVPLPNYYQCKTCKVNVTTFWKLKRHVCKKELSKTCSFCSKKISIEAFTTHLAFHDTKIDEFSSIPIPELMKKYNSINDMWNVVFRCNDCDLVTSLYDSVVEHCQKHINNIQDVLEICEICDFEFVASCYKSHEVLHENESLDRNSFKIITYDYRNLYKSNWEGFLNDLPVEHKSQIMAKSLYRYSRVFKLHSTDPQPPLRGFCMRCPKTMPPELINKHTNCSPSNKFLCPFCTTLFTTQKNLISHQDSYHTEKNRTLITFNLEEDSEFNQNLKKYQIDTRNNDVIPKSKGNKMNDSNVGMDDVKKIVMKQHYNIEHLTPDEKLRYKTLIYQNKLVLYKCVVCKCCSMCKPFVSTHVSCRDNEAKTICEICDEYVLDRIISRHKRVHTLFPELTKASLQIYYFAKSTILQNKIEKKADKNLFKHKKGYYEDKTYKPRARKSKTITPKTSLNNEITPTTSATAGKIAQIFKCMCGLHYTSKRLVEKHIEVCDENLDISKETCSQCNLLFPTEVLVTHLCNHHSKSTKIVITNVKKATIGQCMDCKLNFVYKSDFECHVCDSGVVETCDKCEYTFAKSRMVKHPCSTSNTLYIVNVVPYSRTCTIYKCSKCDICYMSSKAYAYHIDVNHKSYRDIIPCDSCGLNFTSVSLKHHAKHHEGTDTYTIHLIDGETSKETILTGDNIMQTKKRKLESADESSAKKIKNTSLTRSQLKFHSETNDEKSDEKSDDVYDKSDQVSEHSDVVSETSDNEKDDLNESKEMKPMSKTSDSLVKLYKCIACDLHYLKPSSIYYHMKCFDHKKEMPSSTKCTSCGLTFPRNSFTRHQLAHHGKTKFKVEDFTIDTEYSTYLGAINTSIQETTESEKIDSELDISQNDADISGNTDDIEKTSDNLKDSELAGTSKSDTAKTKSKTKKSVNLSLGNKTKTDKITTKDATPANSVSEKSEPNYCLLFQSDTKSDSETDSPKSDKIVYHKCALCNVVFLNKSDCFKHVFDHETLDPISYIQCKVCNFQFLIESLKEHIVTQHKVAFNLDDIIINEYSPAAAVSKTNSYAKDRVQSGLISTTTDGFV